MSRPQEIPVNLLSGVSALINHDVTFSDLKTRAAKGDSVEESTIELIVKSKVLDLEKFGNTKVCDYRDEDGLGCDCVNIGRKIVSGTKMGDVKQIDDDLVNKEIQEQTAPTPVLRGYTGHVEQRKYSYGLANSLSNKEHMLPPEIAKKVKNGIHYGPDLTLGYKGFIRGSQHIAGRTYRNSLKTAMTNEYEDLAQGSLLPTEPQHAAARNFSLEDPRRHIQTL